MEKFTGGTNPAFQVIAETIDNVNTLKTTNSKEKKKKTSALNINLNETTELSKNILSTAFLGKGTIIDSSK